MFSCILTSSSYFWKTVSFGKSPSYLVINIYAEVALRILFYLPFSIIENMCYPLIKQTYLRQSFSLQKKGTKLPTTNMKPKLSNDKPRMKLKSSEKPVTLNILSLQSHYSRNNIKDIREVPWFFSLCGTSSGSSGDICYGCAEPGNRPTAQPGAALTAAVESFLSFAHFGPCPHRTKMAAWR